LSKGRGFPTHTHIHTYAHTQPNSSADEEDEEEPAVVEMRRWNTETKEMEGILCAVGVNCGGTDAYATLSQKGQHKADKSRVLNMVGEHSP
jgi:hypothetical protein